MITHAGFSLLLSFGGLSARMSEDFRLNTRRRRTTAAYYVLLISCYVDNTYSAIAPASIWAVVKDPFEAVEDRGTVKRVVNELDADKLPQTQTLPNSTFTTLPFPLLSVVPPIFAMPSGYFYRRVVLALSVLTTPKCL